MQHFTVDFLRRKKVVNLVNNKKRILCFDISNVLYRTFFANKDENDVTTAGLAHHSALTTLHKYYRQYNPNLVIMTFDRQNWRDTYTRSDACISGKVYKGHRRQTMTPSERQRYENFRLHLQDFEKIMRDHTGIVCLAADLLEADDLMAGVARRYQEEAEVYLISSDKDLMQLLRHDNVHLIDPATDKHRTLVEYNNSADYFVYQKCLRGDAGDNVQSAFPRIRSTRIEKAYQDPFEHESVMNHEWTDQNGKLIKVRELFLENQLLMDLNEQPEGIQELIEQTITDGVNNPGHFSHFHFLKFCGQYGLEKISANVDKYLPMLT